MINIFTILIITYIINICLLKSINNISLKEDVALDACLDELITFEALTSTAKQFGLDVESGVTTAKFISTGNVLIQKKSTSSEVIYHYVPTITVPASTKKYATLELKSDYIGKKGSSGTYTFEMTCDKDILLGDCDKTTIYIASRTVSTTFYVDKCGVTAAYSGDSVPNPGAVSYVHIAAPKVSLLKSKVINVRMSRTINNKISTTFINSDATKYCHVNNINGYYMIFVGKFKANVVKDEAGATANIPLILSDAADIKYYNETNSEIKIICGKKAESSSGGALKNKNSLNSLKAAPTADCDAKYATFNIESDDVKHYFYINSFYLGVISTDKFSIPKSVADGVSAEDQWCFNGLEINKISIININIFIIIILLLLSLL